MSGGCSGADLYVDVAVVVVCRHESCLGAADAQRQCGVQRQPRQVRASTADSRGRQRRLRLLSWRADVWAAGSTDGLRSSVRCGVCAVMAWLVCVECEQRCATSSSAGCGAVCCVLLYVAGCVCVCVWLCETREAVFLCASLAALYGAGALMLLLSVSVPHIRLLQPAVLLR